jgi:hypothetical protein
MGRETKTGESGRHDGFAMISHRLADYPDDRAPRYEGSVQAVKSARMRGSPIRPPTAALRDIHGE